MNGAAADADVTDFACQRPTCGREEKWGSLG